MYFLMCIVFFSFELSSTHVRLTVAHNRDEFVDRLTTPTKWRPKDLSISGVEILAPKDQEKGGTWIGYEKNSTRVAFLTNVRDVEPIVASSRGDLIRSFLESNKSVGEFLNDLHTNGIAYAGYNLVVYSGRELGMYSNCNMNGPVFLQPGIYGLSNNKFGEVWQKVEHGKALFSKVIHSTNNSSPLKIAEAIFPVMKDSEKQMTLASTDEDAIYAYQASSVFLHPFIKRGRTYGTRTTTVLILDSDKPGIYIEKNLDTEWHEKHYQLPILI